MYYDIALKQQIYRGMERCFQVTSVPNKKRKGKLDELLQLEVDYISLIQENPIREGLMKLIDYYRILKTYEIECEIIVYDNMPLLNAWEFPLEFLGVDITYDMGESLLSDVVSGDVKKYLNENGLCEKADDVIHVIPLLEHGDVQWEPCYIYKVL